MILENLPVTIKKIEGDAIEVQTAEGTTVMIPASLLPNVETGQTVYIAADLKPLVSADRHAKDVLNEIMKE